MACAGALAAYLIAAGAPDASAQADPPSIVSDSIPAGPAPPAEPSIRLSGLAFLDYAYTLASPEAGAAGANGFDYRRLYFTADYTLSEAFSGRFRIEAQGTSTTEAGRPAPFVKDAFLRWDGPLAEGHSLTLGVQPPPLFEVAERVWGYRSLEKTLIDRVRANDSRDFGLRADGPLARGLRYAVMVGNGNGLRPEAADQRGKQVYAQLQAAPTETIRATLGVDYTPHEGEAEERDESVKVSAFVGAIGERARGGVEAFAVSTRYVDASRDAERGVGLSVFGALAFGEDGQYRVVARYDYAQAEARRGSEDEHYVLAAIGYAPIPQVEILPNVIVSMLDGREATVVGRVTVSARF